MNFKKALFTASSVLMVAALLVGCAGQTTPSSPAESGPAATDWKSGLDDNVASALALLSDADRTAALTQKVCPITDMQLGSMGKPHKVTVEGQDVFLCCDGCKEDLNKDPAKYLAKLSNN